MKSDGSVIRSFCYLSDATIAFLKVLLDGENNNAYNVANPYQTVSIKELAIKLVSLFPEKNLKAIFMEQSKDYLQSPIKGHIADINKNENHLNWEPQISIEDGFKQTIGSYL